MIDATGKEEERLPEPTELFGQNTQGHEKLAYSVFHHTTIRKCANGSRPTNTERKKSTPPITNTKNF